MPQTPRSRPDARRRHALAGLILAVPLLLGAACSSDDSSGDRDQEGAASKDAASASPTAVSSEQARVNALIATGLQQIEAQQYADAAATFDQVLALDPRNTYATYNLGYLAQVQGDAATAIQQYAATLAEDKEFAPALYNLAILTESSDLGAAVELYRRDLAVKPDDAPAYMRLGFALQHLGEDKEGERMLAKGIALDPSLAEATPPTYP